MVAYFATRGIKTRFIASERNDPYLEKRNFVLRKLINIAYAKSDLTIQQSERSKNYFPKKVRKNSIVVPNPIAVKEFAKENSEKIIDIFIGIKKESIVMSVKNPYEHKLIKDRSGRYLSTKDNKGQHGYGLKSIYKVAEKYGGEVVIYDYENHFTIMIFMNLPQN